MLVCACVGMYAYMCVCGHQCRPNRKKWTVSLRQRKCMCVRERGGMECAGMKDWVLENVRERVCVCARERERELKERPRLKIWQVAI